MPANESGRQPPCRLRLDGASVALFGSDMHLDAGEPALVERFRAALGEAARAAGPPASLTLFLLGDIFEAWVGDDVDDAAGAALADTLAALAGAGATIFLMRGNRDFLMGCAPDGIGAPDFPGRCGATLLEDPCVIDLFDERTVVTHGDGLCTDDVEYQRARALGRSATWQREFLALAPHERHERARGYRALSESSKRGKPAAIMDVNDEAVRTLMRASGAVTLVHGHTHRPARHRLVVPAPGDAGWRAAERWVLPDWRVDPPRGGFLRRDAGGWTRVGDWPR